MYTMTLQTDINDKIAAQDMALYASNLRERARSLYVQLLTQGTTKVTDANGFSVAYNAAFGQAAVTISSNPSFQPGVTGPGTVVGPSFQVAIESAVNTQSVVGPITSIVQVLELNGLYLDAAALGTT